MRTLGVEEELMLVDPASGSLVPVGAAVVASAQPELAPGTSGTDTVVKAEFLQEQVESATPPCTGLEELADFLARGRSRIADAAARHGAAAVAMPTPVVAQDEFHVTAGVRYEGIHDAYGRVARESVISAMHVHVHVQDDEEGVAVLDRVRPWIPVLVALSANSPFWRGVDTGHASWRWNAWRRWPSTGPAEPFGDAETYHRVSRQIVSTGSAQDPALLNYEVRLSTHFPTVEFRVTDVCTDVDDAVAIAGLVRGLVETCAAERSRGDVIPPWRSDELRSASWRAARWGLTDTLVDPTDGRLVAAASAVERLVERTCDALERAGDLPRVRSGLDRMLATGGGATRQRDVHAATSDLVAVVADLAHRTDRS